MVQRALAIRERIGEEPSRCRANADAAFGERGEIGQSASLRIVRPRI